MEVTFSFKSAVTWYVLLRELPLRKQTRLQAWKMQIKNEATFILYNECINIHNKDTYRYIVLARC